MKDIERYNQLAYRFARELTLDYSSSFGIGSRFLGKAIRPHIYAIYGLVRIADEIVDTYQGSEAAALLDELEADVFRAGRLGYSANLIVQAFAQTCRAYNIDPMAVKAFFKSMRMDLSSLHYNSQLYLEYIHGSAEAVGLMCLSVFCPDAKQYARLKPAAQALGAAYQKINFLRDVRSDQRNRGRFYFPGHSYDSFDDIAKDATVHDIASDFQLAGPAINDLPANSRRAVRISFVLYIRLLDKLRDASVADIKRNRIRVSGFEKLQLVVQALTTHKHVQ